METAHLQDGKEVVTDLKHIMSSLGFPSKVLNSKYVEKGRGSLMKADFRCIHKENSCPFRFTIRAMASHSDHQHKNADEVNQTLSYKGECIARGFYAGVIFDTDILNCTVY